MPRVNTSNSWKKVPIKNLYLGLYDGPHATPKPSLSGPIFLGIKNITEDGRLDLSQIRNISEDDFPKWTKRVLPTEGDIVFSYEATLNLYAMIPKGFRGCLGRRLALIRPDTEIVNPKFLYYSFFGEEWRNTISKNLISGATVDRIPLINFPNFEVSIPIHSIQRKIASILSNYDNLIENNTRRIEILEQIAKLVYEEWFVKFRFPGHENVEMVSSELGEIPEGWKVEKLSELVKTQYGYTESATEEEIGPKFLRGKDINKQSYISWDEVPFCSISPEVLDKYLLKKGDIVVIRMADPGKVGIVETEVNAVFASYLIRLEIIKNIKPYYLFYFLQSDKFQNYVIAASTGTTRKSASAGVITNIDLIIPPEYLLTLFEDKIGLLRKQLNILINKNQNLRKTRDLLLPKLISGEIDVSDLDISIRNEYQEHNINFGEPQDEEGLRSKMG
ncbi:Type I restriction-modification system specificity subunit [Methanosarcina barkeri str. Wiesmoor]|uniref:Type I restriction-modification system specificity subunit n=2 Tax=Methanosarcina barkeri TaxID=2208 RepID=A0A0E3QM26_METBA|nr:restriction endonuclease subunit S [Methanosarcina barkeri]AKB51315.1 Type I restriction-modification system specificity subunit [Methanosarcina barkeri str. Wiesmoor]